MKERINSVEKENKRKISYSTGRYFQFSIRYFKFNFIKTLNEILKQSEVKRDLNNLEVKQITAKIGKILYNKK